MNRFTRLFGARQGAAGERERERAGLAPADIERRRDAERAYHEGRTQFLAKYAEYQTALDALPPDAFINMLPMPNAPSAPELPDALYLSRGPNTPDELREMVASFIGHYQQTNLYETDETDESEDSVGSGAPQMPERRHRVGLDIVSPWAVADAVFAAGGQLYAVLDEHCPYDCAG